MSDPDVKNRKGIAAIRAAVAAFTAKLRRRDRGGAKGRATASDVR